MWLVLATMLAGEQFTLTKLDIAVVVLIVLLVGLILARPWRW
jgi:hypothetical protein